MNRESERKRLVELLDNFNQEKFAINLKISILEKYADYLLDNGIVVPPCKVGQEIYRISGDKKEIYGAWELVRMDVYVDEKGFIDDSDNWIAFDDIGKTVFLTREEAEKMLKGSKNNG